MRVNGCATCGREPQLILRVVGHEDVEQTTLQNGEELLWPIQQIEMMLHSIMLSI